jgi:hypothetical protein
MLGKRFLRFYRWPSDIVSPEGPFPHIRFNLDKTLFWIFGLVVFCLLMFIVGYLRAVWKPSGWLVEWIAGIAVIALVVPSLGLLRERYPSGMSDGAWKASLLALAMSFAAPAEFVGRYLGNLIDF